MASDAEAPSKVEIVDDNAPVAEAEAAAPAEVAAPAEAAAKAAAAAPKYSKAEKKARKAILKLGLKEIPGVFRVTLKRNPSVSFCSPSKPSTSRYKEELLSDPNLLFFFCLFIIQIVIHRPEVYKSPTSDTYVIFGEVCLPLLFPQQQKRRKKKVKINGSLTRVFFLFVFVLVHV